MTTTSKLDAAFVEAKRQQLTLLRDQLRTAAAAGEHEESGVQGEAAEQPREFEDDAQKLDMLEKEGILVNRSVERLARVGRALAKIDEGTYGYSDVSGKRIPDARLDAVPEANNTIQEQEQSEQAMEPTVPREV
jgi:DnaK suppressor protein